MIQRILALDPATRTGWAFATAPFTNRQPVGLIDLSKHAGNRGAVFAAFAEALDRLLDRLRPDLVLYELPATRNMRSARLQFGICAEIELAAYRRSFIVAEAQPSQIKKWATGKGNAKKPAMMARAQELNLAHANDDEADAQLLLSWFLEMGAAA